MSGAALEINDAGVLAVDGGELLADSPGYALLLGRLPPVLGSAAQQKSRREPLAIDNRFWFELNQDPMLMRAAEGRSHADLAYLHLAHVKEAFGEHSPSVVCAVPGSMRAPQLALTLSIAQECGLPIVGFMDSAVAAASVWSGRGSFIHIDLQLHCAVITAIAVGDEVRRQRLETVPRVGLAALQDSWMNMISRRFITATRFDPLHQANTEQALFDALPGWLERVTAEESIAAEIVMGEDRHEIQLTREELQLDAQPVYDQILLRLRRLRNAGQAITVGLSSRASRLPGLGARLAELNDCQVTVCSPGVSAFAAAAHAGLWSPSEEGATLLAITPRLPEDNAGRIEPWTSGFAGSSEKRPAPTHVLYRGQAHALRPEPLIVGLAAPQGERQIQIQGATAGISRRHCSLIRTVEGAVVVDHSRYGTWLNDESIVGRASLRAGDQLRLGVPGVTLELIALG